MLSKYFWKDLWHNQVSSRINPRQKWLTDKIPRTWRDADYIIETCVFESLIFFWEEDSGGETLRWAFECPYGAEYGVSATRSVEMKNERKVVYDRLLAAYNWAKYGRKQMEQDYNNALTKYFGENWTRGDNKGLSVAGKIEREMTEKNTFYLKEIVELRDHMWS